MPPRRAREVTPEVGPIGGEQFMRDMVTTMRQIARETQRETQEETQAPPRAAPPSRMITALGHFKKHNPPTYSGGSDPMVAENWLDQIIKLLIVLEIEEDLKVKVATHYFVDGASRWWKFIGDYHDTEVMDWDTFQV